MKLYKFFLPSLLATALLFLIQISYSFSTGFFGIFRVLLGVSVATLLASSTSVILSKDKELLEKPWLARFGVPVPVPQKTAKEKFKEKIVALQVKKEKDKSLQEERMDYQRQHLVQAIKKKHDIKFATTQHLKVQQNLGFGKK